LIEQALALARRFEGFRFHPYLCPAGVATIGFGATRYLNGSKVTLRDAPITRGLGEAMLQHEMQRCAAAVLRLCPTVADSPDKLSALADFVFNLGAGRLQTSTLRRRVNARDWHAAAKEIRRWNKGGGKVLKGLVIRREAEAQLLLRKL